MSSILGFPPPRTRPMQATRTLRPIAWMLAALLLAACTSTSGNLGMIRRVNPPIASLQQVAVLPDGRWHVVLRLNNFSTVPMRFMEVESAVWIDGADAGRIVQAPAMQVPRLNAEVHAFDFEPAPAARAEMQRAVEQGFSYRLEGIIRTEEPEGSFPFAFDGRLTPVPGRPGEFR